MLFRSLQPSSVLDLQRYADIDHFRESERYAKAESIPLAPSDRSIVRASLSFPSSVLSLVRTFPRIINGYEIPGRKVFVIPMDNVASARVNGEAVGGHSIILFKGSANCTVYEPESRLVAIVSIRTEALTNALPRLANGHLLLRLEPFQLSGLQALLRHLLESAAQDPESFRAPGMAERLQATLFEALEMAIRFGQIYGLDRRKTLVRYKEILDRIDAALSSSPTVNATCSHLAEDIGVSVRTLQAAAQSVCGTGIHRYGRLRRLWSVRSHLRTGYPGLTVKASALANGFWHMGEFSSTYRVAFGETPSQTLANSRHSGNCRSN